MFIGPGEWSVKYVLYCIIPVCVDPNSNFIHVMKSNIWSRPKQFDLRDLYSNDQSLNKFFCAALKTTSLT